MAEIRVRHLSKYYGVKAALRDVSLEVHDLEFLVLVGPSGCGKSTLLRSIAGFDHPDAGEIEIDGTRVNDLPPGERGVAMVFQNYALYPHMTAAGNIGFCLRNQRVPRQRVEERVKEVAQILQIETLLSRKPHEMSGGQRQRVAIGRAIVRNPRLYLFDEPLSNLDALLRVQTRIELAKLHQRFRTTTIYVTHDQVEAMTLAGRIAVMNEGRIEQLGAPLELYHRPVNRFVAGFIGSPPMNFLEGKLLTANGNRADVMLSGGNVMGASVDAARSIRAGDRVTVGIRPEDLNASGKSETGLPVSVDVVERLGNRTLLYCSTQSVPQVLLTIDQAEEAGRESGATRVRPGDTIYLSVSPDAVHLFDSRGSAVPRCTFRD